MKKIIADTVSVVMTASMIATAAAPVFAAEEPAEETANVSVQNAPETQTSDADTGTGDTNTGTGEAGTGEETTKTPETQTGENENTQTPSENEGETGEAVSDGQGDAGNESGTTDDMNTETPDQTAGADEGDTAAGSEEGEEPASNDENAGDKTDTPDTGDDNPYRDGTNLTCSLTTDVKVDGTVTSTLNYQPQKAQYQVQVGGRLTLTGVWKKYEDFKKLYILKQNLEKPGSGEGRFREKNLEGDYVWTFYVNPEVVSANMDIVTNTDAWQQAFETGSGDAAKGFFSYMKCTGASYDPATGEVQVKFSINENGTKMVSMNTMEDVAGTKPDFIDAYSPEGAFYIDAANFKKGANAVPGNMTFTGELDLNPWMAMIFPIRFTTATEHSDVQLDVPDAQVTFAVENGTWADGSNEVKTVSVPMDIVNGAAAGTLASDLVPTGMIAAEGYDQEKGEWQPALNLDENGVVLPAEGAAASYTFVFPKKEAPKPDEKPNEKPEQKPSQKPSQSGTTTSKPQNTSKPQSTSKPSKPATGVIEHAGLLAGLGGLSIAGLFGLGQKMRKNKKK